ncbi:MAG: biotin/lipoyl-binding protein [Saprospiraceae bacterium]|nr:biotin/lipoyl-binding protein [Saprospiraceae bacterium]
MLPLIAFLCLKIYASFGGSQRSFYGYAENKETQLSIDESSIVTRILVSSGERVKKGQVLMELNADKIDRDLINLDLSTQERKLEQLVSQKEILASIEKTRAEKEEKYGELKRELDIEESKLVYHRAMLAKDTSATITSGPIVAKIAAIKKEMAALDMIYTRQIEALNDVLRASSPGNAEIAAIQNNKNYLIREKQKLKITAPFDGIVGNVNCKESERVPSHNTLISFYESQPSTAVGYVHESLSLSVNIGDSLWVKSMMHAENVAVGVVTGKGHRIVEIPERMRKIPEYKTYGMEVFIRLTAGNAFLQKEAVGIYPYTKK